MLLSLLLLLLPPKRSSLDCFGVQAQPAQSTVVRRANAWLRLLAEARVASLRQGKDGLKTQHCYFIWICSDVLDVQTLSRSSRHPGKSRCTVTCRMLLTFRCSAAHMALVTPAGRQGYASQLQRVLAPGTSYQPFRSGSHVIWLMT